MVRAAMQIKLTTTGRQDQGQGDVRGLEAHEPVRNRARADVELAVKRFPTYATYQRKTSRQIPVFALKRR